MEKKFDEFEVRDRMRLIKQKFLASMLERRASLQGANTNTQTQETNTRGTSLQPVANTDSLTDNTHDHGTHINKNEYTHTTETEAWRARTHIRAHHQKRKDSQE